MFRFVQLLTPLLLFCATAPLAHAQTGGLVDLFEVDVRTTDTVGTPSRSGDGFSMTADQIAWGDGRLEGRITGELDFSLLAKRPLDDGRMKVFFVGWIFLPGGIEVMYEADGWAVPGRGGVDGQWLVTAHMEFVEAYGPYEWLNEADAAWIGVFDAKEGVGRFRAITGELERANRGP